MADARRLLPCLQRLSKEHEISYLTPRVVEYVAALLKDHQWNALHDLMGRIVAGAPPQLQELVLEETSTAMAEEEMDADRLESMSAKRARLERKVGNDNAAVMANDLPNHSDDETDWSYLHGSILPELAGVNLPLSPFTPDNESNSPPHAPPWTCENALSIALKCIHGTEDANPDATEEVPSGNNAQSSGLPLPHPAVCSAMPASATEGDICHPATIEHLSGNCGQPSSLKEANPQVVPSGEERLSGVEKPGLYEIGCEEVAGEATHVALAGHSTNVPQSSTSVLAGDLPGFRPCNEDAVQSYDFQVGFFGGNTWAPGWTYFGLRGDRYLPGKRPEPNAETVERINSGCVPRSELARAATPAQRWTPQELRILHAGVSRLATRPDFGTPSEWDVSKWEALHAECRLNRSADDLMCRYLNAEAPSVERSIETWDAAEDARLTAAMASMDCETGWIGVATKVGGQRSALSCLRRAVEMQRASAARSRGRKWSEQESKAVVAAVKVHGENWCDVALVVGSRSNQSCMNHYRKRQRPGRIVGKWSEEEAQVLREAVAKEGQSWVRVAKLVPGRSDVQCREKWMNALSPTIRRGMFSLKEKALVLALAHLHHNRWADVARVMTWRTPKQCLRNCKDLRKSEGRGVMAGKKRRAVMGLKRERKSKRVNR